ncbi:pyridoxamine 5'-phosphate oxidase [Desulfuribacillus stibiiarsenatis]|uniref:Pyridoxamine 5'-phosphate oxidase n=1 Tax=Desulfuribacillus stibiiarsenatis TaxID=1390249 RepID=A0A1E5LA54_9FIRM|nr:pyridoxamine 5'-phosphate oxidase family protein [Desulfuribacillus stibiiarsenatis]OEH87001.1 pyridoxamine 5'-phosphate oxidase [Desulfuribacillus stibiiarsenatis]
MNETVKFLSDNPVVYLATVDMNGYPRVRPFQFMFEKDSKVYFCTSNQKDVYAQIQNQPYVEFSSMSKDFSWIRLFGKAVFSNDLNIKKKIIESNDLVRSIYQTPDNPVFEVFYLEDAESTIADFSGKPPRTFRF